MNIAQFVLGNCSPDSANGVDKVVYYLSKQLGNLANNITIINIVKKPDIYTERFIEKNVYSNSESVPIFH